MKPRLLDLFCGAGGAAMGYHRAGFDVVGVDINPQPHYPFEFHQTDALTYPLDGFDAIHASPPCQDHSALRNLTGRDNGTGHMVGLMRTRLSLSNTAWVIENVPGAPMRADFRLCGCMFDLPGLRRERWFETSWRGFDLRSPCYHTDDLVTVAGGGGDASPKERARRKRLGIPPSTIEDKRQAMGIDWMTGNEMAQAIPPAYTEYLGEQLLATIGSAV
jgi:DNA (cytosine-5)-methyltransferase 1